MSVKFSSFALVFLGGGLGASLRYAAALIFQMLQWSPWASTLLVNGLGTFFYFLSLKWGHGQSEWAGPFIRLGLLGSLTTFSTFSFEVANAIKNGQSTQAAAIFFLNILTGVLIAIGMFR